MPPRKARVPVVFDTNILVERFLSRTPHALSWRVYDLWSAERQLQLIVLRSSPNISKFFGASASHRLASGGCKIVYAPHQR